MRFLDADRDQGVGTLQVYLTAAEAQRLRDVLAALLVAPDAWQHQHVFADDGSRELSVSLVTPRKLEELHRYSDVERLVLTEARPRGE